MDNRKNAIRIVECSECLCEHDFICEACKSVDTSTMHSTRSLTFYDDVGNIDFWHCHNCDMWTLTVEKFISKIIIKKMIIFYTPLF